MDVFLFNAWKVEMTEERGEIVHCYFLRTVSEQKWVVAIVGSQSIGSRIFYDIDWTLFKLYGAHFEHEEIETLRSRKAVYGWLDRMCHYGEPENTVFVKVQIIEEHLSGAVDQVLYNNFHTHDSFEKLPMRISNGCFTYLVSGLKSTEWTYFLETFKVKPGYTVFFYYCGFRNYCTVIFNGRRQLSPHDRKFKLRMDGMNDEFYDNDSGPSTDNYADYEDEEEETETESEEESASDIQPDEVVPDDMDLYSSDNEPQSPILRQMDTAANAMDWDRSPSPRGYSDVSSDPDSPKSF